MTVSLFLRTLGRGCDEYLKCFPTWDHLFLLKGRDMKLLGTYFVFYPFIIDIFNLTHNV